MGHEFRETAISVQDALSSGKRATRTVSGGWAGVDGGVATWEFITTM